MRVTHHPSRFDYATDTQDLKRIKYREGARVLTGKKDEWRCVITDEGYFEDLIGPDDLVCIRRFDTELERVPVAGDRISWIAPGVAPACPTLCCLCIAPVYGWFLGYSANGFRNRILLHRTLKTPYSGLERAALSMTCALAPH